MYILCTVKLSCIIIVFLTILAPDLGAPPTGKY